MVLATSPSLECGFAKDIFIRWAPDPRNSIIFTSTTPETSFASRVLKLAKGPSAEKTISCTVTKKVFLEGAELALYEVKERKRLRTEAENKAKEIEEAAMEDMMMGIEDFESESEEEETTQQEGALWTALPVCDFLVPNQTLQSNFEVPSRSAWGSSHRFGIRCSLL